MKKRFSKHRLRLFLEAFFFLSATFLVAIVLQKRSQALKVSDLTRSTKEFNSNLSLIKEEAVYKGLTLIPLEGNAKVLLININGEVVHSWDVDVERALLLKNGHLLVIHGSKWGRKVKPWKDLKNVVAEYDWDGREVWRYRAQGEVHHFILKKPNGNVVFFQQLNLPIKYREKVLDPLLRNAKFKVDKIVEVNREGEVVWEWKSYEHLDLNYCGARGCDRAINQIKTKGAAFDWVHSNTFWFLGENRWYDLGDSRFKPGNFLYLPRNWWTIFLIDRETGNPIWKYDKLEGGHEAYMIPKGFPGEGNILVFNNKPHTLPHRSEILEINPITKTVVWKYSNENFYSRARG
ncbi:MAG: hypothetical protein D6780_03790, partial [Candidatus Dadabacteria bacterium]